MSSFIFKGGILLEVVLGLMNFLSVLHQSDGDNVSVVSFVASLSMSFCLAFLIAVVVSFRTRR